MLEITVPAIPAIDPNKGIDMSSPIFAELLYSKLESLTLCTFA